MVLRSLCGLTQLLILMKLRFFEVFTLEDECGDNTVTVVTMYIPLGFPRLKRRPFQVFTKCADNVID